MLGVVKPPIIRVRGDSGVGFFGKGQPASPPARRFGERRRLPQRPAAKKFSCILEAPDSLSWNLLGASSGGGHGPLPPPPYIRLCQQKKTELTWLLGQLQSAERLFTSISRSPESCTTKRRPDTGVDSCLHSSRGLGAPYTRHVNVTP